MHKNLYRYTHVLTAVLMCLGLMRSTDAHARSSALVIDANTGQVLIDEEAGQAWYPASLTKMMTVYVTLRAIQAGEITGKTSVTVSQRATQVKPSKMGFFPGTVFDVDTGIKILMVKSANDVAISLAERVGGSVEGFVTRMNQEARRLGMIQTQFVNPHGLPDERQQSSARDMALLARALWRDFPNRHRDYAIPAIQVGQKVMVNHNSLVGRYAGTDGLKTGFICASGFNVAASVSRGGQRLIGVVLGAPSATERAERTAELFQRAFILRGQGTGQTVSQIVPSTEGPPDLRPQICSAKNRQQGERSEDSPEVTPPNLNMGEGRHDLTTHPHGRLSSEGAIRHSLLGPKIKPTPLMLSVDTSKAMKPAKKPRKKTTTKASKPKKKAR